MVKIWLDDMRPTPDKSWLWCRTVDEIIMTVNLVEKLGNGNIILSLDNDLGEGLEEGYKVLDWMEATGRNYPIHIHSANPVAVERMRQIIQHNNWEEIRTLTTGR